MKYAKRILAIGLIFMLAIGVSYCRKMIVKATEEDDKEENRVSMVTDELLSIMKDEMDDTFQEKIIQIFDTDAATGIYYQSLFEMYKRTKADEEEKKGNTAHYTMDDIIFKSAFNTGVSSALEQIEENKKAMEAIRYSVENKKKYEYILKDYFTDENGIFNQKAYNDFELIDMDAKRLEKYSETWDRIQAAKNLAEVCYDDSPDKLLKTYLATGDLVAEFLGDDGGSKTAEVIWGFNANLWNNLMETEEYQEFIRVNNTTEKFNSAFWYGTWEGLKDCIADIPRELGMLGHAMSGIKNDATEKAVRDYQEYYQMNTFAGQLSVWIDKKIQGELKPTTQVNVYKPNIYLYADEEIEVQINFLREELLTATIPQYTDNWIAKVYGNGSLSSQNGIYNYLFYESKASRELVTKECGWIVKADEREEALLKILEQYQFNESEKSDFMDFWLNKLETGVDYIVYPQNTSYVDKQMPIEITPKPDNITRLWFGFEKYSGQSISEPLVKPIVRENFTVVEWGGFLLDE